jgi:hypothetical protein
MVFTENLFSLGCFLNSMNVRDGLNPRRLMMVESAEAYVSCCPECEEPERCLASGMGWWSNRRLN